MILRNALIKTVDITMKLPNRKNNYAEEDLLIKPLHPVLLYC